MKFKTNHSPGPFDVHNELIIDDNGQIIAESWGAKSKNICEADKKLFKTSPSMLEYMIYRAKTIDQTINTINANGMIRPTKHEDEELQRILAILKDAGVEVVE